MRHILKHITRSEAAEKKEKLSHAKRVSKRKSEQEQWRREKEGADNARPIYKKEIIHDLDALVDETVDEMPNLLICGIKKNSADRTNSRSGKMATSQQLQRANIYSVSR